MTKHGFHSSFHYSLEESSVVSGASFSPLSMALLLSWVRYARESRPAFPPSCCSHSDRCPPKVYRVPAHHVIRAYQCWGVHVAFIAFRSRPRRVSQLLSKRARLGSSHEYASDARCLWTIGPRKVPSDSDSKSSQVAMPGSVRAANLAVLSGRLSARSLSLLSPPRPRTPTTSLQQPASSINLITRPPQQQQAPRRAPRTPAHPGTVAAKKN